MCSLFGYSGKTNANPLAIKLMAIYGRRRGTDGFGIVIDKKLLKFCGYEKQVDTSDSLALIFGKTIDKSSPVVIGHNRMKSKGWINKDNVHPFEYNDIEGKRWLFAHNGTIGNIEELAEQYNIPIKPGEADSKTFGEIIYRHGFNVLSEYVGFAAFSLFDATENALYLWKGFSQCEATWASEERPLSYYQNKKKDKLYYASEALTLVTAMNTEDNIQDLQDNCLTKIVNGKIVEETYYDRSHIKYVVKTYGHVPVSQYPVQNAFHRNIDKTCAYNIGDQEDIYFRRKRDKDKKKKDNIKYNPELSPQNESKGKVYFWKGKYYINGHLMKGIYLIDEKTLSYRAVDEKNVIEANTDFYSCFINGYMMKDYAAYYRATAEELNFDATDNIYVIAGYIHPRTIAIRSYSDGVWLMYQGNRAINIGEKVVPLYSKYYYGMKADETGKGVVYTEMISPQQLVLQYSKADEIARDKEQLESSAESTNEYYEALVQSMSDFQ